MIGVALAMGGCRAGRPSRLHAGESAAGSGPRRRKTLSATTLGYAVALLAAGCGGGSDQGSVLSGPLIGGTPGAFGIESQGPQGVARANGNRLVAWETVAGRPVVTAVADFWTGSEQRRFLRSGSTVRALADSYAKRWGPADARFVVRLRRGEAFLVRYRSSRLAQVLAESPDADARRGVFVIAITLAVADERGDVPAAVGDVAGVVRSDGMFSVAVLAGTPWSTEGIPWK